MSTVRAILVLTLCIVANCTSVVANAACQLSRLASLDIRTLPDGLITVPVKIDGKPANMLVDTGSFAPMITGAKADELGLERTTRQVDLAETLGSGRISQFVFGKTYEIGDIPGSNPGFLVLPDSSFALEADGILGADTTNMYDMELDFEGGKVNIFTHTLCGDETVYWTKGAATALPFTLDEGHHLLVDLELDGQTVRAWVDTGAATSVMSLELASKLFGLTPANPKMKSLGRLAINGGTAMESYYYPFTGLSLSGLTVRNPQILILPAEADRGRIIAGKMLLGMDVLRQLHLYVAYRDRVIYLSGAEQR